MTTPSRPWQRPKSESTLDAPPRGRPWMNGHAPKSITPTTVADKESPASLINPDLIAWHCGVLFEHCRRLDLSEKGFLVLCAFDPAGDKAKGRVMHYSPTRDDAPAKMAEMAGILAERLNVYAGLTLMKPSLKRGSRGEETDIVAVFGAVIDADLDKEDKPFRLPAISPSFTLITSKLPYENRQPFYLFDSALSVAEATERAAEFHDKTGGDHGSKDITHVWRIAGTLNHPNAAKLKRGRPKDPQLVSVEVAT